jgi:hypothetical protein
LLNSSKVGFWYAIQQGGVAPATLSLKPYSSSPSPSAPCTGVLAPLDWFERRRGQ